jgi:hypothetical protein
MTRLTAVASALIATTLLLGTAAVAAPDGVPNINVQPSCQAEADGIIGLKQDIDTCLKIESNVRDQLVERWNDFAAADRVSCGHLTTMSGGGTYTELLTCLEMKRDAAKLPKEGVGSTVGGAVVR